MRLSDAVRYRHGIKTPKLLDIVKYGYGEFKKHRNSIDWWKGRFLERIILPILFRRNNGTFIVNEDWDNLIILDACRYDMFEAINTIKGKLEFRISRGSCTEEFLIENFYKEKYPDIVYVTPNPFVDKLLKNKFYKLISVWLEGWDAEKNCVLPSTMLEYTLDALKKYPDKRFIIHFLQPHSPFLSLEEYYKTEHRGKDIWDSLIKGEISLREVKKGYRENLKLVLPYVEKLIEVLPGKTVVTSDHGNALGERIHPLFPIRFYGHHAIGLRIEALIKVPWLIIDKGERRDIRAGTERDMLKDRIKRLKKAGKTRWDAPLKVDTKLRNKKK